MTAPFQSYLAAIADLTMRGDACEESYYPALQNLLETLDLPARKTVQVTVLPKTTDAGNPDFRVWDGSHQVIGYIEAKAPGAKLDRVEVSEQLQRYKRTFPNLILTDFYEFRLYRDGIERERADAMQIQELTHLFKTFFSFTLPPFSTAEDLAHALARHTRFLRDDVIRPELSEQAKQKRGALYGFYKTFQERLISGLTEAQFADFYAQTITCGLFAARTRAKEKESFDRELAHRLIPSTIGILRNVFTYISTDNPSPQMATIIDDIAAVLNAADVQSILTQYYQQGKGDDPILHFYETFLAAYDPEIREQRGVYYTPQPVVRFIVRAVHDLLKTRFGLDDGLADECVTLLDPAAGTLTFPAEAVQLAFQEFINKYGASAKGDFLRRHILPNFSAFELLMAPYAIGHMKIGFLLEALGVPLQHGERFQFYLTNALEMEDLQQMVIPNCSSLSEESNHAARVKKDEQIPVIMGNPPYSGISANRNKRTEELLKTDIDGAQSYYTVDGHPLGEKNLKWLQDDYVKFLRFAQWKIHKVGRGIVAMITNHGYLDNPTFRGMRQSLLKTFDEIYILDLHGNSLKRETAPNGGPDENVFDIRQGVAIALMVKHGNPQARGVYHTHRYGKREEKYDWLESHTLSTASCQPITPEPPFYFFTPRQTQNLAAYQSWPSVAEIFPVNSVGIVTARDNLTIRWTPDEMWTTVLRFSQWNEELAREAFQLGKDARDWKVNLAQQDVKRDGGPHREKIVPILYRPFDVRYTYYTGRSRGFQCMPRPKVMRHMLAEENLALILPRRVEHIGAWQHVFITNSIVEHVAVSLKTIDYCFPLYLYPSAGSPQMFRQARRPNLADWLLPKLNDAYRFTPSPEDVLAYIYAILYSSAYRETYAQELRTDFPRIPFTADANLFRQMAALGQQLIDLHLLRNPANTDGVKHQEQGSDRIESVRYQLANEMYSEKHQEQGSDRIERVCYDQSSGRVSINAYTYFEGITPEMWEYRIGGCQVLEKYLKDRKGRQMDDPVRYIRIAAALARTLDIQKDADEFYQRAESNTIARPTHSDATLSSSDQCGADGGGPA